MKYNRSVINKLKFCNCRNYDNLKRFCSQKNTNLTSVNNRVPDDYDVKKVTKEDMVWRKPWTLETKQYFTTLRVFYTEDNKVKLTRWLQSPINLSPSAILNWFKNKKEEKEVVLQSYISERNIILGNEIAAAHFVVFRGGAVKFHGDNKWIKADENGDYSLPEHFVKGRYLEALDCSEMTLYYEGLENFRKLEQLNWLSLNGCENVDDWFVDKVCGVFYKTLVYLDLRNCPNVTELGLTALWKMEALKILYLDDVLRTSSYEMTVLMLQERLPHLEIKVGDLADD